MKVEVTGPEEFQGTCVSMLAARGGIITSAETNESWFTVEGEAPLNSMFGFSADLRSATQGKGEYSMEYSRYAATEKDVQDQIIAEYEAKKQKESGDSGTSSKKKKKN